MPVDSQSRAYLLCGDCERPVYYDSEGDGQCSCDDQPDGYCFQGLDKTGAVLLCSACHSPVTIDEAGREHCGCEPEPDGYRTGSIGAVTAAFPNPTEVTSG